MLYLVSTPIGNLKDISLRALETLKEVDLIACEDTRTSLKLLNRYEIKKPLMSYHKFNEKAASAKLVEELKNGKNIALITDAGTPLVSDPGNVLTKILAEEDLPYTVVPGATAFTSALLLSGLDCGRFAFVGFLPEKKRAAFEVLEKYKNLDCSLVFYSAPHDLKTTLNVLYEALGARKASICKEITKLRERVERIVLGEEISEETPKGEYVVVVEGALSVDDPALEIPIEERVTFYISQGYSKMDAVKTVAKERKIPKSEVYKVSVDL